MPLGANTNKGEISGLLERLNLAGATAKFFDRLLQIREELCPTFTVDDAMIKSQPDLNEWPDGDIVAHDDGTFDHGANAQYGDLWLVDDRIGMEASKKPRIGDRKSTALYIFRLKLLASSSRSKIGDALSHLDKRLFLSFFYDRNNQTSVDGDGDS